MKTRIIYTKFWQDKYITSLKTEEKLLFAYLITNDKIGLSSIYECPIRNISFDTGLNIKLIERTLTRFEKDEKFARFGDWICILNSKKYNANLYKGEKNEVAAKKELELLPADAMEYFTKILG